MGKWWTMEELITLDERADVDKGGPRPWDHVAEYVNESYGNNRTPEACRKRQATKPPRGIRFCWVCGRQLRGNHHVVRYVEDREYVVHKRCADDFDA